MSRKSIEKLQEAMGICLHKSVMHRPIGGNAIGWKSRWICENCGKEFIVKDTDDMIKALELIGTATGMDTLCGSVIARRVLELRVLFESVRDYVSREGACGASDSESGYCELDACVYCKMTKAMQKIEDGS